MTLVGRRRQWLGRCIRCQVEAAGGPERRPLLYVYPAKGDGQIVLFLSFANLQSRRPKRATMKTNATETRRQRTQVAFSGLREISNADAVVDSAVGLRARKSKGRRRDPEARPRIRGHLIELRDGTDQTDQADAERPIVQAGSVKCGAPTR